MKKKDYTKTRHVSPAEQQLWRFVTRHDIAYHEASYQDQEDEALLWQQETADAVAQASSLKTPEIQTATGAEFNNSQAQFLSSLDAGDGQALDKRNATRFKRGEFSIEVIVDLHGQSRLDAFEVLKQAIIASYKHQKRMMLVVTGKGYRGDGVLRQSFAGWMNDAQIRPFILAFARAKAKDGGDGAFYVLIKRQRDDRK